jgi:glycine cleavage system H protein
MSSTPENLQYTKEHEWVLADANNYMMGITDYAQSALGDIVYVQLPKIGESISAGTVCGEVESTKSVSEIFAPVTGVVSAINEALSSAPDLINSDPYGAGWLIKIDITTPPTELLTAGEYAAISA